MSDRRQTPRRRGARDTTTTASGRGVASWDVDGGKEAPRLLASIVEAHPPENHFTVSEVATFYQVSPRTVRNWLCAGLRCWRRGRVVRIPLSALQEWDEHH